MVSTIDIPPRLGERAWPRGPRRISVRTAERRAEQRLRAERGERVDYLLTGPHGEVLTAIVHEPGSWDTGALAAYDKLAAESRTPRAVWYLYKLLLVYTPSDEESMDNLDAQVMDEYGVCMAMNLHDGWVEAPPADRDYLSLGSWAIQVEAFVAKAEAAALVAKKLALANTERNAKKKARKLRSKAMAELEVAAERLLLLPPSPPPSPPSSHLLGHPFALSLESVEPSPTDSTVDILPISLPATLLVSPPSPTPTPDSTPPPSPTTMDTESSIALDSTGAPPAPSSPAKVEPHPKLPPAAARPGKSIGTKKKPRGPKPVPPPQPAKEKVVAPSKPSPPTPTPRPSSASPHPASASPNTPPPSPPLHLPPDSPPPPSLAHGNPGTSDVRRQSCQPSCTRPQKTPEPWTFPIQGSVIIEFSDSEDEDEDVAVAVAPPPPRTASPFPITGVWTPRPPRPTLSAVQSTGPSLFESELVKHHLASRYLVGDASGVGVDSTSPAVRSLSFALKGWFR